MIFHFTTDTLKAYKNDPYKNLNCFSLAILEFTDNYLSILKKDQSYHCLKKVVHTDYDAQKMGLTKNIQIIPLSEGLPGDMLL